jgi:hypothetical protein
MALASPDALSTESQDTPPATPITAKPEYGGLAAPRPRHVGTPVVRISFRTPLEQPEQDDAVSKSVPPPPPNSRMSPDDTDSSPGSSEK